MKKNDFEVKEGLRVNKFDKLFLEPILPAETSTEPDNKEMAERVEYFSEIYEDVGFEIPWVGYCFKNQQGQVVGHGGFSGPPEDGEVRIDHVITYDPSLAVETVIGIYTELVEIAYNSKPKIGVFATSPLDLDVQEVFVKSGFLPYDFHFPDNQGDGDITWRHKKHQEGFVPFVQALQHLQALLEKEHPIADA